MSRPLTEAGQHTARIPAETGAAVRRSRAPRILRPRRSAGPKLSWEDTALAMSADPEDWSDWDTTLADGLDETSREPAKAKRVAETMQS